jgi:hypothetical protein
MNRDFVLVYGEWRTGTNLLLSMFRQRGYLDLNEFYSRFEPRQAEILNDKLYDILCQEVLKKCTMKVMLSQIGVVADKNTDFFTKRVLVYRRDIFSSIISRVVAETRLSWYRSTYAPEQPEFNSILTVYNFLQVAEDVISHYKTFISTGRHEISLDYVVNYEDDLVPVASNNPTDSLPTANYTVRNLEQLKTLFDAKYSYDVSNINQFFDNLRKETNKGDFEQFIN